MPDSNLANNGGSGNVAQRKIRQLAERWGKLPERERAQAEREFEDLVQGMSLAHQEAYREYFRRLAEGARKSP
jgi:hypothetical protein